MATSLPPLNITAAEAAATAWCRLRIAPRWFHTDRIIAAYLSAETAPEHDPVTLFGTPPADARPVRLR